MHVPTLVKQGLIVLAAAVVIAEILRMPSLPPPQRYAITGTGHGHAFILDTVLGTVSCCNAQECWELEERLIPPQAETHTKEPTALQDILGQ